METITPITTSVSLQSQQIPVSFTCPCFLSAVWWDWLPGRYSTSASSSRLRSSLNKYPIAFSGRGHKSDHKWPKTGHHVGCPWKWYHVINWNLLSWRKEFVLVFIFFFFYTYILESTAAFDFVLTGILFMLLFIYLAF